MATKVSAAWRGEGAAAAAPPARGSPQGGTRGPEGSLRTPRGLLRRDPPEVARVGCRLAGEEQGGGLSAPVAPARPLRGFSSPGLGAGGWGAGQWSWRRSGSSEASASCPSVTEPVPQGAGCRAAALCPGNTRSSSLRAVLCLTKAF